MRMHNRAPTPSHPPSVTGFFRVNATLGVQKLYRAKTGFPIGNRDVSPFTIGEWESMRQPGVEPGALGWEPRILPLNY